MTEREEMDPGECLEPELIAGFLDGTLNAKNQTRVEAHLADCDRCHEVLTESARFQLTSDEAAVLSPDEDRPIRLLPAIVGALALASLLVLAVKVVRPDLIDRWFSAGRGARPELAELVTAVGTNRPIEPRITGGFAYGTVRSPVRSGEARVAPPDMRIAAAKLEKEATAHETPETLAALGVAQLVMRDAESAIATLEEATSLGPPGADALSDLSAAFLFRAEEKDRADDLPKALAFAERALKANNGLLEARFNRALALERLSLTGEARKAWEDYLNHDSASPWAAEARRHLEKLEEIVPMSRLWDARRSELRAAALRGDRAFIGETARRFAQPLREYLEEEILPAWGDAVLDKKDHQARTTLVVAGRVADGLVEATGDRLSRDAVSAIEDAVAKPVRGRVMGLARGHRAFRQGRQLYEGDRPTDSEAAFKASRVEFQKAGSPFVEWARLNEAICAYHRAEFSTATADLDRLIELARDRRYLALEGRALWIRGLIHAVSGRYSEWLADDQAALARFEQTGDRENASFMHLGLSGSFLDLGEPVQSWRYQRLALTEIPLVFNPWRRQAILVSAALTCLSEGLPEAALPFQNAVLDSAEAWQRPAAVVEAYEHRSRIQRELGDVRRALIDLQHAKSWLPRVADARFASRVEAELLHAEGEVLREARPTEAVGAATAAIAMFRDVGFDSRLSEVFLLRGRAHLAAGETDLAESDFLTGIDAFERERKTVGDEQLRVSFLDNRWALFEEMIRLQAVRRNRPDAAFRFAERARARTLLEATTAGSPFVEAEPAVIPARLQPETQLLYYVVLPDRLLMWMFSRQGQSFHMRMTPLVRLDQLVQSFRTSIDRSAPASQQNRLAGELYDDLIRPFAEQIVSGAELIVVPDGPLHGVPFGALYDVTRARYLIQDHPIGVAPSATLYFQANARRLHAQDPRVKRSVLVVGNPRVDPGEFPDLPLLREADQEAHEIAAIYGDAELLTGDRATKSRFLAEAGRHTIVHFAGHAVQNPEFPLLSKLLFTPESKEPGSSTLLGRQLSGLRLSDTRLVILASCQTASGTLRRGEGVLSLARPFLSAGVPSVVASLWDVNDQVARLIFGTFHRGIRDGLDAVSALREGQVSLIESDDAQLSAPASWAGIVAFGG